MNIPGFTAEASLNRGGGSYLGTMPAGIAGVVASYKDESTMSCGPCMELKWPNGTGTGACIKYCYDGQGREEQRDCTCPPKRKGLLY